MKIKTCAARIKAAGPHEGTPDGEFDALVATYDLDSVGDKIVPGAFAETLADWAKSGDPIPVYWSHRMDDPNMNIGTVLNAQETDQGLEVKAQLDLDNPVATQVYKLLKGRRVTQFSFAYDIEEGAYVQSQDERSYYELRKLKLYELGPTPIGANQETDLLEVKAGDRTVTLEVRNASKEDSAVIGLAVRRALGAKEGRRNSADDQAEIQSIHDMTAKLGADCSTQAEASASAAQKDAAQATPTTTATTQEPDGAPVAGPAWDGAASIRLRTEIGLMTADLT